MRYKQMYEKKRIKQICEITPNICKVFGMTEFIIRNHVFLTYNDTIQKWECIILYKEYLYWWVYLPS